MRNPIRVLGDLAEIDLLDRDSNVVATALIDVDDVDRVADRRWVINRKNGYVYAHGRGHLRTRRTAIEPVGGEAAC